MSQRARDIATDNRQGSWVYRGTGPTGAISRQTVTTVCHEVSSATQPQLGDEASISLHVLTSEVVEETTPLADHHQEPTPTVMVVLVLTEMLGEMVDPLAEQGDLDFW